MNMDVATHARWYAARIKHGAYIGGKEAPEHYIWREMIRRCKMGLPYYEEVRVCRRWRQSYMAFLKDVGLRPSPEHQLDRKNPFGDYKPENVRWATRSQQQSNKRSTRMFAEGKRVGTLTQWAQQLGISKALALWRMKNWGTFQRGRIWRELPKTR